MTKLKNSNKLIIHEKVTSMLIYILRRVGKFPKLGKNKLGRLGLGLITFKVTFILIKIIGQLRLLKKKKVI